MSKKINLLGLAQESINLQTQLCQRYTLYPLNGMFIGLYFSQMAQIQQTDLKSLLIVKVLVKVINRLNVFPFSVSIFITFSDLSSFFRAQKNMIYFCFDFWADLMKLLGTYSGVQLSQINKVKCRNKRRNVFYDWAQDS